MRFVPEPNLERKLDVEALKRDKAQEIAHHASRIMPRGDDPRRGHIADRFKVEGNTVGNVDPFFHLAEFGSVNNPAYAPLRRAVRAAGLRLEDAGRQ